MNNYKILVLGKNGMLGRYFSTYLTQKGFDVCALGRDELDVYDKTFKYLYEYFGKFKATDKKIVVLNCIGLVHQTGCKDPEKFLSLNAYFPKTLSVICKYYGWELIHPTTDCVYDGNDGPYVESDVANETGTYGLSKALCEPLDATVIKVSIIGEELDHKYSLIEWIKSNKGNTIKGFKNHLWNGITCLQYAKLVEQIMIENRFWKGTYHIYSPRVVSKYELAQLVNKVYNLGLTIEEFNTPKDCDKTLASNYPEVNDSFNIPDLSVQIQDLHDFDIFGNCMYGNN